MDNQGEDPKSTLIREIREELGVVIIQARPLIKFSYSYPEQTLSFDVWYVTRWHGEVYGREGQLIAWVPASGLSKKNFPDPMKIVDKYGADALRFYLLASPIMNADNINFSEKGVEEIYKKVLLLLQNTNRFYAMYQEKKGKVKIPKSENILDKWIIARLNKSVLNVKQLLDEYNTIKACSEIRGFVDELSTWYVRRSRDRFNEGDKDAKETLKFVLNEFARICAPIMPFISENIYQGINGKKESVHLQNWPKADKKINEDVIENMDQTREVVSLALRERDRAKISVRQPLSKLTVTGAELSQEYLDLILDEVNVKEIELKVNHEASEISVKLDTKLTPELESEGYAREVSRQVQASRKKLGLEKKDEIELFIIIENDFKDILDKQKDFIKERTNSKKLEIISEDSERVTTHKERFKNTFDFKIKDKKGVIAINC